MALLPVTMAAAVAVSLTVLVWSVTAARTTHRAATSNLTRGPDRTDLRTLVLERAAHERAGRPVAMWLADLGARLSRTSSRARYERLLLLVGVDPTRGLQRMLGQKVLMATSGALLGVVVLAGRQTTSTLLLALALPATGWVVPDSLLRARARRRQEQVRRELPDTLDQLTVCVEAGDGFEGALRRVARSGDGPLAHELRRALQEMQVGATRAQALRSLADRADLPEFRRFVTALLQAETYGIPIARILRAQATEMRVRRRQRSEEHALKIPVKLVFPLITCILPSLFIVILGPAAIRLMQFFGGTGTL